MYYSKIYVHNAYVICFDYCFTNTDDNIYYSDANICSIIIIIISTPTINYIIVIRYLLSLLYVELRCRLHSAGPCIPLRDSKKKKFNNNIIIGTNKKIRYKLV